MVDCEIRTSQSPTIGVLLASFKCNQSLKFHVEGFPAGYYQYPGQRPGKVEKEICLLDTCSPSRGQRDCQRSLGRTNGQSGSETVESGTIPDGNRDDRQASELILPIYTDLSPYTNDWESYGIYERTDTYVLGTERENEEEDSTIQSRCFNCGHPDHKVTDCPIRANRELIALSRQYHDFYQSARGVGNFQRFHTVEAWRQQRLDWLEEFEPGTIKGELLKDAISNGNDEWLKNISVWGYPLGWVGHIDPRERVRDRIWNENNGDVEELGAAEILEIYGDEEVVELLSFKHSESDEEVKEKRTPTPSPTTSRFPSPSLSAPSLCSMPAIRWATYPTSYFSSQALVLYNPPTRSESWDSSVFIDTESYLNQFSTFNQPPPPQDEPPPLPPGPPGFGLPRITLHHSLFASTLVEVPIEGKQDVEQDMSECDMELSDSD
jgi:zinc finger CCHC domain-containing protein 8